MPSPAVARITCPGQHISQLHVCHLPVTSLTLAPPTTFPGQHIGQLDHLLPSEYVTKMRDNLLDRCPVSDYAEVGAVTRGVDWF